MPLVHVWFVTELTNRPNKFLTLLFFYTGAKAEKPLLEVMFTLLVKLCINSKQILRNKCVCLTDDIEIIKWCFYSIPFSSNDVFVSPMTARTYYN